VVPISTGLLPLGQFPLFEINNALLLLSTQAFTTGVDVLFAMAKPLATVAPKTNAVTTLKVTDPLTSSPLKVKLVKLGMNNNLST
jgi:hypothetical protein